jgi:hypothetical protein
MKQALALLAEASLDTTTTNLVAHIIEIAYTEGKISGIEECTKTVVEQFGLKP